MKKTDDLLIYIKNANKRKIKTNIVHTKFKFQEYSITKTAFLVTVSITIPYHTYFKTHILLV